MSYKQIIDGKVYNTKTATKLASEWNGRTWDDAYYALTALYRSKNGNYFLYENGNLYSRIGAVERIIKLSVDEAKEFAVKHASADEYQAAFGELEEA